MGGSYRSQVFNYVDNNSYVVDEKYYGETEAFPDKQHQNFIHGYMGFVSTDKEMPIQFQAEVGLNSFKEKYPVMYHDDANKETNFYVSGDVWKQFANDYRFGLNVRFDNYAYSSDWADNWQAADLNPYFQAESDDWKVRLGAHIDWKGGEEDKVYVSPDVKAEYVFSDSYVLFAKAGGGRQLSSLYELAEIAPYSYECYVLPTYMKLDAALGLKASPANGWWFLLSGGYQIRENDVCLALGGLGYPYWYTYNVYGDTKVFYGTVELKHDYKDLFDFSLKGTYYNWKWENTAWAGGDLTDTALSLKPELEMNAEVGFKPIEGLRVNVGYEYVKRASDMYDPINNLYAGADYALLKNLSVFAKVNNLLNKEYVRHDAYPAQKLNFLGGVSLQF